jgi:hypothetical protein
MAHEATSPAQDEAEEIRRLHDQIAALAYALWEARGCPAGSSEEDWFQAEEKLKNTVRSL